MPQSQREFAFNKEIIITVRKQNPNHYYDIDSKQIGKGAFGTVFEGKVAGTDDVRRAIKKIDRKAIASYELLVNEIEIMMFVDHPSVIKLYEIFQWKNSVYLVTDLCQGGQLFEKLQEVGTFSEETTRIIFRQMLQGIKYLHHNQIAHRDLKPENFLFVRKGSLNLKLIDFGLAYCWEENMEKELKKAGERKLVGTSYYLSPEVADFKYDQRCDIWSAGVILYMLVTGTPPFDGETDKQIIRNVKRIDYSMEIPEFDGISNELKDLIEKILVPADDRITIEEIFNHPWMKMNLPPCPLAIDFNKMAAFARYSKLKKLTAIFVASECSQKQVEKLAQIFRQMDKEKNGTISIQQLKMALEFQTEDSSLHQVKNMMDSIDMVKDGTINYIEFLACLMDKDHVFTQKNLKIMFDRLDFDGNGTVEKEELMALLEQHGIEQYNGRSLQQIIDSCDYDKDGKITFDELKTSALA